ncbi:MAG: topoisomerase [Acidimicrobiia bacterium]|nr:topoisomerase [Acidimicrobiia bacterium]
MARARQATKQPQGGLLGEVEFHDPVGVAEVAGLVYVQDSAPGIRRRRAGKGFSYRAANGSPIRDTATLARIRALVIPPAWSDVWICAHADGHLQCTGFDARGRKQYRYHIRWRQVRDAMKFERLLDFGAVLPMLRTRADADLSRGDLSLRRVIAAVVRLLDETQIRVGNEEYARDNDSYGLTTLRDHHADITSGRICFTFPGKSGKRIERTVSDRRLARLVRRCQELPGQILFQYIDSDGNPHPVDSRDVNRYLQEVTGQPFTAKDFRTWAASVSVAASLRGHGAPESMTGSRKRVVAAVKAAANELANTPTVCRASYIHPAVVDAYLEGDLAGIDQRSVRRELATHPGLSADEALLMSLLRRQQAEAIRGGGVRLRAISS